MAWAPACSSAARAWPQAARQGGKCQSIHTRGEAGSGVQGPLAGSHQAVHFPGGLMLFAVIQTAPSPACHQHQAWNPSYRRLRGRAGQTAIQHLASPLPALLLPKPSCYNRAIAGESCVWGASYLLTLVTNHSLTKEHSTEKRKPQTIYY